MSDCDSYCDQIPLYIDGELTHQNRAAFLEHLTHCAVCQTALAEEEAFSARIKRARPQLAAPAPLRARLEGLIQEADAAPLLLGTANRLRRAVRMWSPALTAAATLLFVAGGGFAVYEYQHHSSEAVIQAAIQAHDQLQDHSTSLQIVSSSPAAVTSWFASRLSFPFQLANAGIAADDQAKYKLDGGKLLLVRNEPAALVSFHLPKEQVSMLVMPQRLLKASGGTVVLSGGIALHSRDVGPVHVVTWNNRGLAYVLSASTSMGNPHSCQTCHQVSPVRQNSPQTNALEKQVPSFHAALLNPEQGSGQRLSGSKGNTDSTAAR